jgi:hypothetical protein
VNYDLRSGRAVFLKNTAAPEARADAVYQKALASRVSPTTPLPVPPLPAGFDATKVSSAFLAEHGAVFALKDPLQSLIPVPPAADDLGMVHVAFNQVHGGVPVYASQAVVHLTGDGKVSSVSASVMPDLTVSTLATVTRDEASAHALTAFQAQFPLSTPSVVSVKPYVFCPGFIRNDADSTAYLVWEVRIVGKRSACEECPPIADENPFLDAHGDGALVFQLSNSRQDSYRKIYDCSIYYLTDPNACWSEKVIPRYLGYTFGRREGAPARGQNPVPGNNGATDVDILYDLIGGLNQMYVEETGRNGPNGKGGAGDGTDFPFNYIASFAFHETGFPGECRNGAGAWFFPGRTEYCMGNVVPDMVGHEASHAVSYYRWDTAGNLNSLANWGDSGALNESFSDIC